MSINICSSSTYTSSNSTIRISNSTITANNCEIYGDTPNEVLSKYRSGEKEIFRMEQQRLSNISKLETERIRQEYKISQRRWRIDNVNLSDEEYKIVEDYMNDIKPLWEIW